VDIAVVAIIKEVSGLADLQPPVLYEERFRFLFEHGGVCRPLA